MSQAEFDRFAHQYNEIHAANIALTGEAPDYFAAYKMTDFTAELKRVGAPAHGRYLDFGSGIGASVRPFLERWPQGRLVCADVSEASLTQSRVEHGDAVDYELIRDGALELPDHSVDGAFACCVFHHIPPAEHAPALLELHRVLKPGAPLMVYEHNPFNPLTVRAVNTCPLDENAILIRAGEMRRRCVAAGFRQPRIAYRVFFPAALRRLRSWEPRLTAVPLGAQYAIHAQA
jgi:ubiquinone/menaquinone biosynthesis C-methylase UbiE